MDKREQIKKYFEPLPKWTVLSILVGVVALYAYGLGVILIGLGVWGIAKWRKKPDEAQMDTWLDEDLAAVRTKALQAAGVGAKDVIAEPAIITGPRLWDVAKAVTASRKGKDGKLRFTPIAVVVFNFTPDCIAVYQCALDLLTGERLQDQDAKHAYGDVVSASTTTMTRVVQIAGKATVHLNAAETFVLGTSRGASVELLLRDPSLCQMLGGGEISMTRNEKAIQAIQKMLLEGRSVSA